MSPPADTRRHRRLVTRDEWEQAQAAWSTFSSEWEPWRRLAQESGIVGPPEGTEWDDWTDPEPSHRAVVIRAIRETPELLRYAITAKGAPTWGKVVALLAQARDEWRADLSREASRDEQRRADEPDTRQATYALSEVLRIIGDSR